jgi:hypothetical protein
MIEFSGRKPRRMVGPFLDEVHALRWYASEGGDAKVSFHEMEHPVPLAGTLPLIPQNFRLRQEPPQFVRDPESPQDWLLLGAAADLPEGKPIHAALRDGTLAPVMIGRHIAEHSIWHRGNPEKTRYVLATIDKSVKWE